MSGTRGNQPRLNNRTLATAGSFTNMGLSINGYSHSKKKQFNESTCSYVLHTNKQAFCCLETMILAQIKLLLTVVEQGNLLVITDVKRTTLAPKFGKELSVKENLLVVKSFKFVFSILV